MKEIFLTVADRTDDQPSFLLHPERIAMCILINRGSCNERKEIKADIIKKEHS